MPECWVSKVVTKTNRFDQIFVCPERTGDCAPNLGYFQRVSKPGAVIVAFIVYEDLGFIFQPAEGGRMQNAVAVALE
jgi:hypothetical protein